MQMSAAWTLTTAGKRRSRQRMNNCLTDNDLDAIIRGRNVPAVDRSRLDVHLSTCGKCREELARRSSSAVGVDAFRGIHRPIGVDDPTIATQSAQASAYPGYEIISKIGEGGQGIVYKVRHQGLDVLRAMKVLDRPLGPQRYETEARFRREATAAARLEHPNIVPVYDFGQTDRSLYYVMKLVEGEPLDALIRRVEAPQVRNDTAAFRQVVPNATQTTYYRQVAAWIADLCDALQHAHAAGVLHRDIKPANVIIDASARPMLTDFGLAKDLGAGDDLTLPGSLSGTPAYMSPEQARGDAPDLRTDVYSLGATLYTLLTLQRPFNAPHPQRVIDMVKTEAPPAPAAVAKDVPPGIDAVCRRAMEKDPSHRYASAADMGTALRAWLHDDATGEKQQAADRAKPESAPGQSTATTTAHSDQERRPSNAKRLAVAAVIAALLAAGGFGVSRLIPRRAPVAAPSHVTDASSSDQMTPVQPASDASAPAADSTSSAVPLPEELTAPAFDEDDADAQSSTAPAEHGTAPTVAIATASDDSDAAAATGAPVTSLIDVAPDASSHPEAAVATEAPNEASHPSQDSADVAADESQAAVAEASPSTARAWPVRKTPVVAVIVMESTAREPAWSIDGYFQAALSERLTRDGCDVRPLQFRLEGELDRLAAIDALFEAQTHDVLVWVQVEATYAAPIRSGALAGLHNWRASVRLQYDLVPVQEGRPARDFSPQGFVHSFSDRQLEPNRLDDAITAAGKDLCKTIHQDWIQVYAALAQEDRNEAPQEASPQTSREAP